MILQKHFNPFLMYLLLFLSASIYANTPVIDANGIISYTGNPGSIDTIELTDDGSDLTIAVTENGTLTNHTFSLASVSHFRFIRFEHHDVLTNNSQAYAEMIHNYERDAMIYEMIDMFNLVRYKDITHKSVQSGPWSNPSTWEGGIVPSQGARVLIEKAHTVTIASVIVENMRTVRVDGGIAFAINVDTQLTVDTMIVNAGGSFEMGNENTPIAANVTAKLVIENIGEFEVNDPSSADYDPTKLGLGFISHGSVTIHGKRKTSYANFEGASAGATSVVLDELPADWEIGDTIVITGIQKNGIGDEQRVITGVSGNTVSFLPLQFDHTLPMHTKQGLHLKLQVANISRNAVFTTKEGENRSVLVNEEFKYRGHTMFMHNNANDVRYAGFYFLGRTNKQGVMKNAKRDATTGAITEIAQNPIARYPLHFHRAGNHHHMGLVKGCTVVDSPGWGYVNHRSAVHITENVAYDIRGAGFIAEAGDELGSFTKNLAIRTIGNGLENFSALESFSPRFQTNIFNFGSAGDGYWSHSLFVKMHDNIASGFTGSGFHVWNQYIDDILEDPNDKNIPPELLTDFDYSRNTAYGGFTALSLSFVEFNTDRTRYHQVNDFVGFHVEIGMRRKYSKQGFFRNMILIGDLDHPKGKAVSTHSNGKSFIYENAHMEGFLTGMEFEHRPQECLVIGGYFNNVYNLFIHPRNEREVNLIYRGDLNFGTLSDDALNNVASDNVPIFDGNQYDYYGFLDIKQELDEEEGLDPTLTESAISNYIIEQNGQYYRTYLETEQQASFVPWPETATNPSWVGLTNQELIDNSFIGGVQCGEIYDPATVVGPAARSFNVVMEPANGEDLEFPKALLIKDFTAIEIVVGNQASLDLSEYFIDPTDFGLEYNLNENSDPTIVDAQLNGTVLNLDGLVIGQSVLRVRVKPLINGRKEIYDVTVDVVPDAPMSIVNDDTFETAFNTEKQFIPVLVNDVDETGFGLTIDAVTQGANGSVTIEAGQTLTYQPNAGFSGTDTFTYTAIDFYGNTFTATVTATVLPEPTNFDVNIIEGYSITIEAPGTVDSVSVPANGLAVFEDNIITYFQTEDNHNGADSFTYTTTNSGGTVNITIHSLENVAPIAKAPLDYAVYDTDATGDEYVVLDGSLSIDPIGNIVAYEWDIPGIGTFNDAVVSTSLPLGVYTITLTVTDDGGLTGTDTVIVTVAQNENIALFKPVDSSHGKSAVKETFINDADENTKFTSHVETDQTITIDLENQYEIDSMIIKWAGTHAIGYSIQVSDDGVNWSTVYTETNGNGNTDAFDVNTTGAFMRIHATEKAPTNFGYNIWEWEAYGRLLNNADPVAHAHFDQIVYDLDGDLTELVELNGALSSDANGSIVSYSWDVPGVGTVTGVNPEVTLPIGIHDIVLTVTDNFGATSTDTVTIEVKPVTTGVLALEDIAVSKGIIMYPNPVNNGSILHIISKSETFKDYTITIHSMEGKLIYNKASTSNGLVNEVITIEGLQAAVYFLTISKGNQKEIMRLIVQ